MSLLSYAPQRAYAALVNGYQLKVAWYGGGQRKVEAVTGTAHWYKSGPPLVELRRVFVHDLIGTRHLCGGNPQAGAKCFIDRRNSFGPARWGFGEVRAINV